MIKPNSASSGVEVDVSAAVPTDSGQSGIKKIAGGAGRFALMALAIIGVQMLVDAGIRVARGGKFIAPKPMTEAEATAKQTAYENRMADKIGDAVGEEISKLPGVNGNDIADHVVARLEPKFDAIRGSLSELNQTVARGFSSLNVVGEKQLAAAQDMPTKLAEALIKAGIIKVTT